MTAKLTKLNHYAKQTLAAYGITQAAWLRLYPYCDQCGCPDDRCIGFHHADDQPDSCDLSEWIRIDLEQGRIKRDAWRSAWDASRPPLTRDCFHLLDDSDVPGYAIVCTICGQLWVRGPRVGPLRYVERKGC